jgi:hypothetical protein
MRLIERIDQRAMGLAGQDQIVFQAVAAGGTQGWYSAVIQALRVQDAASAGTLPASQAAGAPRCGVAKKQHAIDRAAAVPIEAVGDIPARDEPALAMGNDRHLGEGAPLGLHLGTQPLSHLADRNAVAKRSGGVVEVSNVVAGCERWILAHQLREAPPCRRGSVTPPMDGQQQRRLCRNRIGHRLASHSFFRLLIQLWRTNPTPNCVPILLQFAAFALDAHPQNCDLAPSSLL